MLLSACVVHLGISGYDCQRNFETRERKKKIGSIDLQIETKKTTFL